MLFRSQKSQKKFRDEMKTEEGARVRQIAAELKDQLEEMEHIAGAESFVRYFYKKTESLLEYLPENTLVVIDEPNRLTEHAKTTEEEFRESMIWALSQQPARRNCSTGEDAGYPRQDGKTPWSFTVA